MEKGFHLSLLFVEQLSAFPAVSIKHCASLHFERRSPFINIKPIWAEKLQCLNDVYTSALMSYLVIQLLEIRVHSVRLLRKINDPVLPQPSNIMWHLKKAKKQRLKQSRFQRSVICVFRGKTVWWEREKYISLRLSIVFISQQCCLFYPLYAEINLNTDLTNYNFRKLYIFLVCLLTLTIILILPRYHVWHKNMLQYFHEE